MLRKRTRSHQKDQPMDHLVSDDLGQKQKNNSIFNVPGLFIGLRPKGLEHESVHSPTSPLDFRLLSPLGNPFRSRKSSHDKSWGCSKVGLSIIDSLEDETNSVKVIRSSDSKNVLMGAKISSVLSRFDSFEAPKSLPNSPAIFSSKHTVRLSNLHKGNSDVQFEIGETLIEDESFRKIQSYSLDSGYYAPRLINIKTKFSNGKFCLDNGTRSADLPYTFITGKSNLSSSTSKTVTPMAVTASEIELSEDYTCVRKHGPNSKTTHIYGDCILECHNNELMDSIKNEVQEPILPPCVDVFTIPISYPSNEFLSFCYYCKKQLEGEDIYMYRGEKAFCSATCRAQVILLEEAFEKTKDISSENSLEPNDYLRLACSSLHKGAVIAGHSRYAHDC